MASRDHGIAHRCIKICMTSWVYFVAMAIEQLCMPSMDPDAAEIMQVIPYHTIPVQTLNSHLQIVLWREELFPDRFSLEHI